MPKRELINRAPASATHAATQRADSRCIIRRVGRSFAADRRTKAQRTVPKGQGDRGDQARPSKS